jgi:hypothetical protein
VRGEGREERKVEIVEISGRHELWIDNWTVPLVAPREVDGGRIEFIVDHRLGYVVDAANFESVAKLLADVIAVAWGYACHPRDGDFDKARFVRVPHPTLAPRHKVELGGPPHPEEADRG